jgi:hypothetical protein
MKYYVQHHWIFQYYVEAGQSGYGAKQVGYHYAKIYFLQYKIPMRLCLTISIQMNGSINAEAQSNGQTGLPQEPHQRQSQTTLT